MAKVTTDNIHYTRIADTIRYYNGNSDTYTPAQMPEAIGKTCRQHYSFGRTDGYGQGFSEATEQEKNACAQKHYSGSFWGNDTRDISLSIPFQPQLLLIYTTYPFAASQAGTFIKMAMDLRSADRYTGNIMCCNSSGTVTNTRVPSSSRDSIFSYADGVFTFQPLENQLPGVLWRSGVRYCVTAANFGIENTAAILAQQILDLPDAVPQGNTGELIFNKATVESCFMNGEWERLVAGKPNWTITLV